MKGLKWIVLGCMVSVNTYALNIAPPSNFSSAKVLPKGVRNLRFVGILASANNRFANTGQPMRTGDSLNVPISYNNFLASSNDAAQAAETKAYLVSNGVTDFGAPVGNTTGVVSVTATIQVPAIAVGVTRKWTLAAAVPIVTTKVNADTGFESSDELDQLASKMDADALRNRRQDIQSKTNNAINIAARDNGYDPIENSELTHIGDIRLISKYNLTNKEAYAVTLQNELTLPTGEEADVNKLINAPTGDGQTDVAAGLVADFYLGKMFTFSQSVNYTAQLPDKQALRIPHTSASIITPEIDSQTDRDLGDIMGTQSVLKFEPIAGLNFQGAVGYQYKAPDKFTGDEYPQYRYDYLSNNTEQYMVTGQLGLSYNTISLYRRKKFPVPLSVGINHTMVLKGKNVFKDPLTSFDLAMFF